MLRALVEHIVKSLVEYPDHVSVYKADRDGAQVLMIAVDKNDTGRLIGKDGQTIKAIRSLVFAIMDTADVSDVIIDNQE